MAGCYVGNEHSNWLPVHGLAFVVDYYAEVSVRYRMTFKSRIKASVSSASENNFTFFSVPSTSTERRLGTLNRLGN